MVIRAKRKGLLRGAGLVVVAVCSMRYTVACSLREKPK